MATEDDPAPIAPGIANRGEKAEVARETGTLCARCLVELALTPESENDENLEGARRWLDDAPIVAEENASAEAVASGTARSFGHYDLLDELGRGGMGVIYRARQRGSGRTVALKMILPDQLQSAAVIARFRAESEAVASLDHPAILPIYEVGERGGLPFFSMKLAEGGNLTRRMAEYADPRKAAQLMATLARAVHHAHQRGILHRDLKPGNILLDATGAPFVNDFGLAKWLGRDDALTLSNAAIGTPAYAAPEQVSGRSVDLTTAADVYSLGAILYELLAGNPPFFGPTPLDVVRQVVEEQPPALRSRVAGVPRDLEIVCMKCLAKEPAARYPTAEALADDLERFLDGRPIRARSASAAERSWRWARRNPRLAILSGALLALLLAVVLGSTIAAARLAAARNRAVGAEHDATERLYTSYLAQARASRRTGRAGQRFDSVAALSQAARIHPSVEVRNEAIAALALADLAPEKEWPVRANLRQPITFAPDLDRYAVESDPGVVSVRAVADGHEITHLPAPEGAPRVTFLAPFSADGRWIAARHADGRLRVWDVPAARVALDLPNRPGAAKLVQFGFDCAFRADGRQVAIGLPGGGFSLHDLGTGDETGRVATPKSPAILQYNPAGTHIALSVNAETGVQVIELATGNATRDLAHASAVTALAWSPDGRTLATACADSSIHLWNAATGEQRLTLLGHRQLVTQLLFNRTGEWLVSTASDKTIRFWDVRTGAPLVTLAGRGGEPNLRLAPDDARLAFTSWSTTANILRVARPEIWRPLRGDTAKERAGLFAALDFSPDGRLIATSSITGVRVFDAKTGDKLAALPVDGEVEKSALFQPDGAALLISSRTTALSRWLFHETGDSTAANPHAIEFGAREVIDASAGSLLTAVGGEDHNTAALINGEKGEIYLMSMADPAKRSVLAGQPDVWQATFSADGRWVATAITGMRKNAGDAVKIWDARDGHLVRDLEVGSGGMATFSPAGSLMTALGSKGAGLWEPGSWQPGPKVSKELRDNGIAPTFSPDGELLTFTVGENIHLLRAATAELVAVLEPPSPLSSARVRFSPDGARLAALGSDGALQLWDLHLLRQELSSLGVDWETQSAKR